VGETGEKQDMPGSSPWKKFQSLEGEQDLDQVEVFLPGGECRIVKLEKGPFFIGRDESSDIVLDDLKASRKHARLEFDGVNYRLTDLNSTNGSFFGKTRLLPGIDETWDPEKPLRIGDHYLRLVRITRGEETVKFKGEGTLVDWKPAVSSHEKGWVGVAVPQLNLFVEAGKSVMLAFSVINQGDSADHFQISIEGLPEEWVLNIPAPLQITPGKSMEVTLPFQPPPRSDSRATRYPFILRVKSQNNPAEIAETRCALTILPFSQFSSQLEPQSIKSPENGKVIIYNQGNVEEAFTITFYERGENLVFSLSESKLRISEGKFEAL
jgi:pSer/pThr/pTyr-binding forkhead associated (FHA) protein